MEIAMQPNLLIIYDNPPSYRERSFWSSPKEYEDNRLWLIREAHKIISFPALKERVANIYELFVYAFEDIQVFSHPASYFVSDHPAYIKKPLCGLIDGISPDIMVVVGRKVVNTLVERCCKGLGNAVQVVWAPFPFRRECLHRYELQDVSSKIEDALRFYTNAHYAGSI